MDGNFLVEKTIHFWVINGNDYGNDLTEKILLTMLGRCLG
jgi:hypothetical protein